MVRKYWYNKSGNLSIVFALLATACLIVVGTVVDLSIVVKDRSELQNMLDNATLNASITASKAAIYDEQADYQKAGEDMFDFPSRFKAENLKRLTFTISPDGDRMIGEVLVNHDFAFGGIIGKKRQNIALRSVANVLAEAEHHPACIIALSTTAQPGLLLNSGAEILSEECEVHIHSTADPAFTKNSGTDIDVAKVCIAGRKILNNGGAIDNLEKECTVNADPYVGRFPIPNTNSCDYNNGNYGQLNVTLKPGVYCGWHNFNNSAANVNFQPGTYILKNGGWNVNGGNWTANGVTFYYADTSKIQFNSAVKATITAPTSGHYAGVAFTEAPNLSRTQKPFNDSRGFDVTGLIYLPSREVIWNSGSQLNARRMNFVVDRIIFNQSKFAMDASALVTSAATSTSIGSVTTSTYLVE